VTDARETVIDYDQIALGYARHRKVHPEVLRSLLVESGIDGQSSVLEVGCGTGNYVVAVESATGCLGWGIDPSKEMLAEASARPGSVTFKVGRAQRLPFPAGFFDLVFSVDVIHHLRNVRAYFREVRRVLKPGGYVCTVTDSEWIIRHREPLAAYFPESVAVDLARYPRLSELRALMGDAGFAELSEHTVEFPYELRDAQAYRDRAFSSLLLIGEEAWKRGLARMERDLRAGPIACVSRYVLLWGTRRTHKNACSTTLPLRERPA
jgi:ubiquinone/menaquinone biosynthesis C-methylase UbiE